MEDLKHHVIQELREAREQLLTIPKSQLTGQEFNKWTQIHGNALLRADVVTGDLLPYNIQFLLQGSLQEQNHDVCLSLRSRIVQLIDHSLQAIDGSQMVTPVLDDLILRVSDPKLATLLREFNQARDNQPNLAACGFRTILSLILIERAKRVNANHTLANSQDIVFDRDMNLAINDKALFTEAEIKFLKRHRQGGWSEPKILIQRGSLYPRNLEAGPEL